MWVRANSYYLGSCISQGPPIVVGLMYIIFKAIFARFNVMAVISRSDAILLTSTTGLGPSASWSNIECLRLIHGRLWPFLGLGSRKRLIGGLCDRYASPFDE